MNRQIVTLLALLALSLGLAACDKCGGFEEIRYPHPSTACKGGPSR